MGENKTTNQIMQEIKKGLKGDIKKDAQYLLGLMEKYRGTEDGPEYIKCVGRIMTAMIPQDKMGDVDQYVFNQLRIMELEIGEVGALIEAKQLDKAYEKSVAIVSKIERINLFQDDNEYIYYDFDELMEEVMYIYMYNPTRKVKKAMLPVARMYYNHGIILTELKQYKEAIESFNKAKKWNPVGAENGLACAQAYKMLGDLENFKKETEEVLKFVFAPKLLAQCYRNQGYYHVENDNAEVGVAYYMLSTKYDYDDKSAMSEIYYIRSTRGSEFQEISYDDLAEYANEFDVPFTYREKVLGVAASYGKGSIERNNTEATIYFYEIFYKLTEDEDLKVMLDGLHKKLEEEKKIEEEKK